VNALGGFSVDEIDSLLAELDERLRERGVRASVYVVGEAPSHTSRRAETG
jgi:hypothetical protein